MSALPHWDTRPDDLGPAIVSTKNAIRRKIEATTGRSVEAIVDELEAELADEVASIVATREAGDQVIPEILNAPQSDDGAAW